MTSSGGDQESAIGAVLAFHIDEILVHVGMLGEELIEVDRFGDHLELAGEEAWLFSVRGLFISKSGKVVLPISVQGPKETRNRACPGEARGPGGRRRA